MAHTLRLAEQLIAQASVTPADAACQQISRTRLEAIGFVCEPMHSGPGQWRVTNLWAKRAAGPVAPVAVRCKLLVFAGHTDVAELGPPNASIHQIDEHVRIEDIEPLKNIYLRVLENLSSGDLA